MVDIPAAYRDLVTGTHYATIATVLPDGTPHQTVTWIDYDGECLVVNTAEGRRKVKNVRANPRVSVMVIDSADAHRYLSVQGEVVEIAEEGAADHANEMGLRYTNEENFMDRYGDDVTRVLLRIRPDHVITH